MKSLSLFGILEEMVMLDAQAGMCASLDSWSTKCINAHATACAHKHMQLHARAECAGVCAW